MQLKELFSDKSLKPKERTEKLAKLVTEKVIIPENLIDYAKTAKDPVKATCIESLEFATAAEPSIMTSKAFLAVLGFLDEKAPRVKWESAKVTANCIHLFPEHIETAVKKLLDNTECPGTVVRWSAATALSQIIKLKTPINSHLIPAVESIAASEEKNSIKKIYADAIKKVKNRNI